MNQRCLARKPQLPKISAPHLYNVLRRPRVIALFDRDRERPLLWVSGGPGEGKTIAVVDYLNARKKRFAWLNLDDADKDPATFFYYLGLAIAAALPRQRLDFPIFEQAHHADAPAYARLFFRYLATRVTRPLTLVFDNTQAAGINIVVQAIEIAACELSSFYKLIVISRERVPPAWARLLANQQLSTIEPKQLRFTRQEADDWATLCAEGSAVSNALYEQTQGWAAGLVLLRETHCSQLPLVNGVSNGDLLFEYFSIEVLSQTPPESRELLLCTAFLPFVPLPIAQILCQSKHIEQLLDNLCVRNIFTQRINKGKLTIYAYHALFREFLQNRALTTFPPEQIRTLQAQSGRLLQQLGYMEDAVSLFLQYGFYQEAAEHILQSAAELCRQGRQQILNRWLSALPENLRQTNPWFLFWLGETWFAQGDDRQAREQLEAAYEHFVKLDDCFGQLLTAATLLEAMQWGDTTYREVDRWAAVLRENYEQRSNKIHPDDELRIVTGRLLASLLLGELTTELLSIAERLQGLLVQGGDPDRQLGAATVLAGYYFMTSQRQNACSLAWTAQMILPLPQLSQSRRATWLAIWGYYLAFRENDPQQAQKLWDEAQIIAEEAQLTRPLLAAQLHRIEWALYEHRLDQAQEILDAVQTKIEKVRGLYRVIFHQHKGWMLCLRGDYEESVYHAQLALAHCKLIDLPQRLRDGYETALLRAYVVRGSYSEAEQLIADMTARGKSNPQANCLFTILRGYMAHQQGHRAEALVFLREAFTILREHRYTILPRLAPKIAQQVCSLAIEENIETEYVCSVAAKHKLVTPRQDWLHWPRPIRIHCLGRMSVSSTVQDKSILKNVALLSILLSYGEYKPSIDEIAAKLWPGEGRVGRRSTFDSAVYRLRKFLPHDDALIVEDQHIYLNSEIVWVDAWAVEALLARVQDCANDNEATHLEVFAPQILSLYRGHLLGEVADSLRFVEARERLWGKARRFILRLGAEREKNNRFNEAITAYRVGMELDPLAAEFCHAMIRVLKILNRSSEALEIYTTYARLMRTTLGKEPNEEIVRLLARH